VTLGELASRLDALDDWSAASLHAAISGLAAEQGLALGKLAQPLRLAICGGTVSPPIDVTLSVVGRSEALARISTAIRAWRR
jgi:glutamyl-tRNA synthetase